jgi:hypothetical protein
VLKELGVSIVTANKGTFSVSLKKKSVKKKNVATSEYEEKEIYFVQSECGKLDFPADLLLLKAEKKVSTKLEVLDVQYNPRGYIVRVIGVFQ